MLSIHNLFFFLTTILHLTQSFSLPTGRVLGGGSSINWMLYVRGNRRDFDNWEAMGNPYWGYRHVLPFFKKAEDYSGPGSGKLAR